MESGLFLTFMVNSAVEMVLHPRSTAGINEKSGSLPGCSHGGLFAAAGAHVRHLPWLLWGLQISSGQKVKGWRDGWPTQWIKLWTLHYLWLGTYGVSPAALRGAEKVPSAALARPVRVCWTKKQTEQRHLNLQLGLKSWEAKPVQKRQQSNCSSLCISMCAYPRVQEKYYTHIVFKPLLC